MCPIKIESASDGSFVVTDESGNRKRFSPVQVAGGIVSTPPEGHKKVTELYINPATGKLVVRYKA